jgi:two-component system CAI-1 autoinducer sensor kinase/phosphatase CqsS
MLALTDEVIGNHETMWDKGLRWAGGVLQRLQREVQQSLLQYERQYDHITTRFVVLAWVGVIGMPLYYLIWTVVFPQGYENLALRAVGVLMCVPALCLRRLLRGPMLSAYLFVATTYVLPFLFTFMFLMNDGSIVWSQSLLVAVTVLFHFPTLWAGAAYLVGVVAACAAFALVGDAAVLATPRVLSQLPIHLLAIFSVWKAKVGRQVLAEV